MTEEALAVAFHPSGFHIVVALVDKILMMNVLSKSLNPFKNLPIKACREVRFSNGGHLFAAAAANNQIFVYNFYTGECPSYYQCKGHGNKVRSIDWYEDDMGFVSCGLDGSVLEYDLIVYKDT
jgi:cilia- and flagella-associated protein 57